MKYFLIIFLFSNVIFAYDYGYDVLHLGVNMNGYFNYLSVKDKNNKTSNAYLYGLGNGLDEVVSFDKNLSFFYNPTFIFATGNFTNNNDANKNLLFLSIDVIMGLETDFIKNNYIRFGIKLGITTSFESEYYSFLDLGAEITIGEKIRVKKELYDIYLAFYYGALNYIFEEKIYKEINSNLRITIGSKWYFF